MARKPYPSDVTDDESIKPTSRETNAIKLAYRVKVANRSDDAVFQADLVFEVFEGTTLPDIGVDIRKKGLIATERRAGQVQQGGSKNYTEYAQIYASYIALGGFLGTPASLIQSWGSQRKKR